MEVTLNPKLQAYVEQKVACGEYPSASDILNAAVQQFQTQNDAPDPLPLEEMRRAAAIGVEEEKNGQFAL